MQLHDALDQLGMIFFIDILIGEDVPIWDAKIFACAREAANVRISGLVMIWTREKFVWT